MKVLPIALGLLASHAIAADHSVGFAEGGLNLYSISNKGVELVAGSPFTLHELGVPGALYSPLLITMNPTHTFVYAVYMSSGSQPQVVGLQIRDNALVYKWTREMYTGDAGLQGSTIDAVPHFLVEYTYPSPGLFLHVLDESGSQVVYDAGSNGADLVSGHIDPNGRFYYSCRNLEQSGGQGRPVGPADAVAVYALDNPVTENTIPLLTSTDPVFVQSECSAGPS